MNQQERIDAIKAAPQGSIFMVKKHHLYWRVGDRGYTESKDEAKHFTKEDVIARLHNNFFMDKTIEVYTPLIAI